MLRRYGLKKPDKAVNQTVKVYFFKLRFSCADTIVIGQKAEKIRIFTKNFFRKLKFEKV